VSLLVSALTVLTAVALLPLFRDLPPGRPGRDRDQRRRRVPQPARPAADPAAAARQLRPGHAHAAGRAAAGRAGRAAAGGGDLHPAAAQPPEPPGHLGPRPGPARPRLRALDHEPAARAEPGLLVLRLDAPLLFINAKLLRDRVREQLAAAETPVRIVLLDLQFTPALDIESLDVLTALRGELFQRGVALWLANARAEVQGLLRRSGRAEAVGEARIYRSLADAIPDARGALRS
jgi:MFS superfamily sulfate permease-like transporter